MSHVKSAKRIREEDETVQDGTVRDGKRARSTAPCLVESRFAAVMCPVLLALVGSHLSLTACRAMACLNKRNAGFKVPYESIRPWTTLELCGVSAPKRASVTHRVHRLVDVHADATGQIPAWISTLPSLKYVSFSQNYNQPIGVARIPDNVQFLNMGYFFYKHPITTGELPTKLRCLTMGHWFNKPFDEDVLPESLESLILGNQFNQKFGLRSLPSHLKLLRIGYNFNQTWDQGVLPDSLQSLVLGHDFNQPFAKGVLPGGLKLLALGSYFNQRFLEGVLPFDLLSLTVGHNFDQQFDQGVLPAGLQCLALDHCFDQPFHQGVLPAKLCSLTLGQMYDQNSACSLFPLALREMHFKGDLYYNPPMVFKPSDNAMPPHGPVGSKFLPGILRVCRSCNDDDSDFANAILLMKLFAQRLPTHLQVVTLRGRHLL
jgi:hypothetical protein